MIVEFRFQVQVLSSSSPINVRDPIKLVLKGFTEYGIGDHLSLHVPNLVEVMRYALATFQSRCTRILLIYPLLLT